MVVDMATKTQAREARLKAKRDMINGEAADTPEAASEAPEETPTDNEAEKK